MNPFKNTSVNNNNNGIQLAIDRAYKELVYNRIISMSDYKEILETIKMPIKNLIEKQKNNNIKYQLIIPVEFYKNTASGRNYRKLV